MDRGINPGLGLAILRIVLGVIFVAHGWPKFAAMSDVIGMFGSLGIPLPTVAAWGVALLETVGGLLLIAGLFVTPVAALLAIHMIAGIFLVHLANGFYVIGEGAGGIEFNLILAAGLFVMIFVGAGSWALQERFAKEVVKA